jgi:hypothetical protein
MRYRLLDQRGQVTVLAALLLPAMLVASLGTLEAANAYRQNLALQRAASAAARAVADLATAADLSAPEPPPWMEEEARRIAEEALGPDLAPERVTVRWADEAGTVPAPGRSYSLDVTVPDFITSSTTLRWGDPHSFNYLVPQFVTQAAQRWASFSFRHEDTWLDPGRRSGDVSHTHMYWDDSYDCPGNRCYSPNFYGVGLSAWGYGIVVYFGPLPVPIPVSWFLPDATNIVVAFADPPGIWQWGSARVPNTSLPDVTSVSVPYDLPNSRTGTGSGWFTHQDTWLVRTGYSQQAGSTLANPQQATVGPYAVYVGDTTVPGVARPFPPDAARRTLVVEVEGRLRSVTPLVGPMFDGVRHSGRASYWVERR